MIASGTLTTIAMNLSSNKMNNEITIDSNKNNNKVLDENIDSLEQIDQELVLNSLVQKGSDVVINYQLFLNQNLTSEFIDLIKNFQLINTNINDAKQLLFGETKKDANFSVYSINDWRIHVEKPKAWYSWIIGTWGLDFNHELIQDICYDAETLGSLVQIVGDTGIYAAAATVVNITLNISSLVLNKIDKGNGIVIRFFAWVIPKKIAGADYKW